MPRVQYTGPAALTTPVSPRFKRRSSVMAVKPLEDRVLVKPIEAEAKPPRASTFPSLPKKSPCAARSLGRPRQAPRKRQTPEMSVKIGDTVVYGNTPAPRSRSRVKSTHPPRVRTPRRLSSADPAPHAPPKPARTARPPARWCSPGAHALRSAPFHEDPTCPPSRSCSKTPPSPR